MGRRLAIAAFVALIAAGCGNDTAPSADATEAHDLAGTVRVERYFYHHPDQSCEGYTLFADVLAGAAVTVADGEGSTLAIGRLDEGRYHDGPEDLGDDWCEFEFEVDDVPGAHFYSVQIANRPARRYAARELDQADWRVDIRFTESDGERGL